MLTALTAIKNEILSPSRKIRGRVAFYKDATDTESFFTYEDALQSIEVSRAGEESKFFGFGICQKATIKLRDNERQININKGDAFLPSFGADIGTRVAYSASAYARMYVDEVKRDENSNVITITVSDKLYTDAFKYTYNDLAMEVPYSIQDVAVACATKLGLGFIKDDTTATNAFSKVYNESANFEGTETLRDVLNAIAEATQTIYYIRGTDLHFKCLLQNSVDYTIDKAQYFTLTSESQYTLAAICSATELGDNVIATADFEGITQYVRDNPFWDTQEDIGDLVNNALATISGIQSHQFDCSWRGNFLLEVGDKVEFIAKDNSSIYGYFLNDTTKYDGGFKQTTNWSYESKEGETATNPASLGEALSQTFARVDKVNKQIDLVVSEVQNNNESIAQLQLNTGEIKASVEATQEQVNSLNGEIATLTNRVEMNATPEDVSIQIIEALANGVDKVETATGFRFDAEGLTISKSNNEITTTITEDGMKVYRNSEAVLVADNEGVKAEDLHATTYLIIGTNSRFEDYGSGRTGCFWIG